MRISIMRILDYINGYEKRRYKKSQIYIGKKEDAPSNVRRGFQTTAMWTEGDKPNKMFIAGSLKDMNTRNPRNIDYVAHSVGHEELHNLLQKEVGDRASIGLDRIIPGAISVKQMAGKEKGLRTHFGPSEMVMGPTTTRIIRQKIKKLPTTVNKKIVDFDYIFER